MNRLIFIMLFAVLLLLTAPLTVQAAVTYGDHVTGLYRNFYTTDASQTWITVGQGPCFDPTHTGPDGYDRIYLANDEATTAAKSGLYVIDIYNSTYSGPLAGSGVQTHSNDCVVDDKGNAYLVYDYTTQLWKITDPLGTPTVTQTLGLYGPGTDDDPFCVDVVPSWRFNVGGDNFEPGLDLVVFDNDLGQGGPEAVTIVDKNSTLASQIFDTIWSSSAGQNGYGASNKFDGYYYVARYGSGTLLLTGVVGSDTLPYIERMKSNGTMERVYLNDPTMQREIDNSIECNPVDGSVWIPIRTPGTQDHIYYRIDAANAASLGGGYYLAEITAEVTITDDDGYNVVTNGFAISPDGKYLAVCASDGQDQIYVYSIVSEKIITLDTLQLDLAEAGPTTGSYTVTCEEQPDPNVVIIATPSSIYGIGEPNHIKLNAAGWGESISLVFSSTNWETPQTVAVTIKDDGIWNRPGVYDEDTYTLVVEHSAVSTDPDFDGYLVKDFTATVTDDDVPAMTITESNNWTLVEEGGATDSYVVAITGVEPNASVLVEIDPNNAEVKLNGGTAGATLTLTFTTGNWETPQTVTVTADDDADVEGWGYTMLASTVSTSQYAGYPLGDVKVFIEDDEAPSPALYKDIVLYVPFDGDLKDYSGHNNDGTAMGGAGTYDTGRFGQAIDLDGVNDWIEVDEVAPYTAGCETHITVSKWVKTVEIADKYFVSCNTAAKGNVVLIGEQYGLYKAYDTSNHLTQTPISDGQWHHLVFTRSGALTTLYVDGVAEHTYNSTFVMNADDLWSIGQEWDTNPSQFVDALIDDVAIWTRVLSPLEIARLAYNNQPAPYGPGLRVTPAAEPLVVAEGGDPNTFTVALNTQPSADVFVELDPDPNEVSLGAGLGVNVTLTFTSANWDTEQTVTISTVDDTTYNDEPTITISMEASGDADYLGVTASIDVEYVENDTPTMTIDPPSLAIIEADSDTYTVVLDLNPKVDVLVTVDPNGAPEENGMEVNLGNGFGVPVVLTFTTGNYSTPQTITVTVIGDTVLTADRISRITHTAASAGDYDQVTGDDELVTILEDECGHWGFDPMDFNEDCYVDLVDMASLISEWLGCTMPYQSGCVDLSD
ncbi:MAG: LamG domain-containing protein [Sedimentisphaerales bacterium]|nr:LamG domain-containing protein [Sedimentisphaerales bacterium]